MTNICCKNSHVKINENCCLNAGTSTEYSFPSTILCDSEKQIKLHQSRLRSLSICNSKCGFDESLLISKKRQNLNTMESERGSIINQSSDFKFHLIQDEQCNNVAKFNHSRQASLSYKAFPKLSSCSIIQTSDNAPKSVLINHNFYKNKLNRRLKTSNKSLFNFNFNAALSKYIAFLIMEMLSLNYFGSKFIFAECRANDVYIDWTITSNLFNKGNYITTKYVRMKDVLHIRCAPVISFNIYIVPAKSAMLCKLPTNVSTDLASNLMQTIGSCSPNTGDPQVNIRSSSLLPNRPVFKEGQSYFIITTSSGTSDGVENTEGGLCQSHGMRLRLVVLGSTSNVLNDTISSIEEVFPNDNLHWKTTITTPINFISSAENLSLLPNQEDIMRRPSHRSYKTDFYVNENNGIDEKTDDIVTETQKNPYYIWPNFSNALHTSKKKGIRINKKDYNSLSSDGFPAVLTLDDHGKIKNILVHNSKQLQHEINHASKSNLRVQQIQEYMSHQQYIPQYSLTGHGQINAIPITVNDASRKKVDLSLQDKQWRSPTNFVSKNNINFGSIHDNNLDKAIQKDVPKAYYLSSSSKSSAYADINSEKKNPNHLSFTYIVGYTKNGDSSSEEVLTSSSATKIGGLETILMLQMFHFTFVLFGLYFI